MKINIIVLTSICIAIASGCSKPKTIEVPLTQKEGYGYFQSALGGLSPYNEDENNPWKKTFLKVTGVPENWTEI